MQIQIFCASVRHQWSICVWVLANRLHFTAEVGSATFHISSINFAKPLSLMTNKAALHACWAPPSFPIKNVLNRRKVYCWAQTKKISLSWFTSLWRILRLGKSCNLINLTSFETNKNNGNSNFTTSGVFDKKWMRKSCKMIIYYGVQCSLIFNWLINTSQKRTAAQLFLIPSILSKNLMQNMIFNNTELLQARIISILESMST